MPTGACPSGDARRVGLRAVAVLLAGVLWAACANGTATPTPAPTATPGPAATEPEVSTGSRLRYVALGDSYTIGTSVVGLDRWPNQLVARVPALELVDNLAVNGFTSRDVIAVELPQLDALQPDFLTLLIGVNDVVQGVPAATYREHLRVILDDAVDRVGPERVLVVTTPDYTVTPAGADYGDPAARAASIREFNEILRSVAQAFAIEVVDIHDISLEAAGDPSLVAADGLHPSGAQYSRWVDRIEVAVLALLAADAR